VLAFADAFVIVAAVLGVSALLVLMLPSLRPTVIRARPEIIESTSDRVNIEFTTEFSYHIWWS
jgi:hypothetical protein